MSIVKAVFVGDTSVGKTCVITRIHTDEWQDTAATVGASNCNVTIDVNDQKSVRFAIWDTAGQEKFRSLAPVYFSGASLAFCVFDITRQDSIKVLQIYVDMLKQRAPEHVKLILVGNKLDLEKDRQVTTAYAEEYQHEIGADFYMEVSALTGSGIRELFMQAAMIPDLHIESDYGSIGTLEMNSDGKAAKGKCSC